MAFIRPLLPLGRTEQINIELVKFLDKVCATIEEFDSCLKAFCSANLTKVKHSVKEIDKLETETDNARRKIEKLIAAEGFMPDKEDKIELLEHVDNLADQAEIASWNMDITKIKLKKEIAQNLLECGKILVKLTKDLKKCILSLSIDFKRALEMAAEVESQRNEIRAIIHAFRHKIFKARIEPKLLLILFDLSYRIMRIADAAEETGDRIATMVVKTI